MTARRVIAPALLCAFFFALPLHTQAQPDAKPDASTLFVRSDEERALSDAVAFYATRDTNPQRWYPKLKTGEADKFDDLPGGYKANVNVEEVPYDRKPGERPRLDDADIDALVAFLNTLTDKGMR